MSGAGPLLWGFIMANVKPLPAPHVPGKTEFERFGNAVGQVLTVSKTELIKREQREKQKPEAKRPKKS